MSSADMSVPEFFLPVLGRTGVHYFDYAATTFMPECVMNRWHQVSEECGVFLGRGNSLLTRRAEDIIAESESLLRRFFGLMDTYAFAYVKNVTEGINLVALGLEKQLQPLDMIVVGPYEHHSNYLPWRALAQRTGALFCEIPLDEQGDPDYGYLERFRERIKVVSVSAVSNLFGFRLNIPRICEVISKDAFMLVDDSQVCGHEAISIESRINIHFLASHKMYGPKNIALTAFDTRAMEACEPILLGGGMVDTVGHELVWASGRRKFMAGTMDTALIAAWAEACRFVGSITIPKLAERDSYGNARVRSVLDRLGWLVLGNEVCCAPHILTFVHPEIHAHDVNDYLSQQHNVIIRSGHLCAQNSVRKMEQNAVNRISFGAGVTIEDLDHLCVALEELEYA